MPALQAVVSGIRSPVVDAFSDALILLRRRLDYESSSLLCWVIGQYHSRYPRPRTARRCLRIKADRALLSFTSHDPNPNVAGTARAIVATYTHIKSKRIAVGQGIPDDVAVRVDATFQPDRIALDIPPDGRVVVAEVVVVEVGLLVEVVTPELALAPDRHHGETNRDQRNYHDVNALN